MERTTAYFIQPPVWFGEPFHLNLAELSAPTRSWLEEEVGCWARPMDVEIRALRGGRLVFTFENDQYKLPTPGVAPVNFKTLGEIHRRRLAIINAHQVCVHS